MTESQYTQRFTRLLTDRGAMVIPMVAGMRSRPGLPDRYISHWRFRGWIECKHGKNKLSPIQKVTMREMIKRGESISVLRYIDAACWRLEELDGELLYIGPPNDVITYLLGA